MAQHGENAGDHVKAASEVPTAYAENERNSPEKCGASQLKIKGGSKAQAAYPLNASSNSTPIPIGLPSTRMALVAPMLPLPTLRMSMPLAFATRKPNGIEPSKYAPSATRR